MAPRTDSRAQHRTKTIRFDGTRRLSNRRRTTAAGTDILPGAIQSPEPTGPTRVSGTTRADSLITCVVHCAIGNRRTRSRHEPWRRKPAPTRYSLPGVVGKAVPVTRRHAFIVLTVVGNIAWFAGLLRIFAEAAARLLSAVRPTGLGESDFVVLGITVALIAGVEVVLLPWYRRFFRQMRSDLAALNGVPVEKMPTLGAGLQRAWKAVLVNVGGAIVVALVLPGLVAAALAMVAGLALRLVGVAIAAGSPSGSTSP
jgi:hypothetical protein